MTDDIKVTPEDEKEVVSEMPEKEEATEETKAE